ncbi:class I SAM-dependent methyltransferase [Halobacteriovorax sp. GB3]|uniref:class I SAM-dependent methyltransferase n=1 Tax=Halobacteriovorax sp. GB3 TaxID=2719615 RepID=UPI00236086FA|nr:class I SAM-dependent methyltransferase [Halobacteriovorax sp. GB3]MDD0852908.1 class I SAM-dependent methyltransferase [Halobacteriovorax sp. GB3]
MNREVLRKLANRLNAFRYSLYAPLYPLTRYFFKKARSRSLSTLNELINNSNPSKKVLIVGCGDGQDLEFLRYDHHIYLTDFSRVMLDKATTRAKGYGFSHIHAKTMSADDLQFENDSFDVVILNLIITVVSDHEAVVREARRVLKSGGLISVFDKSIDSRRPGLFISIINFFTTLVATSINVYLDGIFKKFNLEILDKRNLLLGGLFKSYLLKKS